MAKIKIDFTTSSWEKARPKEVKGAKLTTALKALEKAKSQEKKKGDGAALQACVEAVNAASSAAQDAMKKECDAKKHKDVVNALKTFTADCKAEIKRLEEAIKSGGDADDDGDEVSDDDLFGLKLFKECIKKAKLKTNTEDGVSFCLGIHKDPLECKLVFLKKKKFYSQLFKQVLKVAKKKPELGLKRPKMTYGIAYRDPESRETLVLHVADGAPTDIPGMARKLEKWRKKNKQDLLPFKELSIRQPNGTPIEFTPDPDEGEEQVASENAPAAEEAAANGAPATEEVAADDSAEAAAEAPAAEAPAPAAEAAATPAADAEATEDRRKQFKKARTVWQKVRDQAIQDLEAVKDGIRDYYLDDPDQFKVATGKLSQLDAIMDNLGDELRDKLNEYVSTPRTRQADLERLGDEAKDIVNQFLGYASSDRLLNAVDQKEFADVKVKEPLEKALKALVKAIG